MQIIFLFLVPFAVEEKSGVITVIDELSKFNRPMYDFEAVAVQESLNLTIATNATVHVVDVNDERGVLLRYRKYLSISSHLLFTFIMCFNKVIL